MNRTASGHHVVGGNTSSQWVCECDIAVATTRAILSVNVFDSRLHLEVKEAPFQQPLPPPHPPMGQPGCFHMEPQQERVALLPCRGHRLTSKNKSHGVVYSLSPVLLPKSGNTYGINSLLTLQ